MFDFKINKDIADYILQRKNKMKDGEILNLLEDYIKNMLSFKLSKKRILREINEQLQLNISYDNFYAFLRRRKLTKRIQQTQTQTQIQNINTITNEKTKKDPFSVLR
jgi:hypothetical protein